MRDGLELGARSHKRRGVFLGILVAVVGTSAVSALAGVSKLEGKPGPGLLYLLVVMVAAAVGGLWIGLVTSIASFVEYGYFFVGPTHSFAITESSAVGLGGFLLAALLVSYLLFQAQRALAELRASRHTLELAMQSGAMGSWEWRPAADQLSLSEEAERLLGLRVGTFSGGAAEFLALVDPDDRARAATALERASEPGTVVAVDLHLLRTDGVAQWLELRGRTVSGAPDDVARVVGVLVDVTARIRREREQKFLADGSEILSSSPDYEETLARVAQLAIPALADWCSVDLVSATGEIENVAVAHLDPQKVELARRLQAEYPPDPEAATGIPAVIRTGCSELYPEITDEVLAAVTVDERQLGIARDLGLRSAITAPLTAGGRTFGAITFVSAESERRYADGDLALLEELARRAATAVDNARLYAEQGDARDQAEEAWAQVSRLQAVTAALSEAATTTEVAEAIVREGLVAIRAHAAAVVRLGSGGTEFEVLASTGFPEALRGRWSVDAANVEGPSLEAIRTRQVVVVESAEQLVSRWPHLAEPQMLTGLNATIAAPLLVGGDAMGVIHMSFREPRRFDAATQEFLTTLARQGAQALERARLYEAEGTAREHAERLTNRLRRLQLIVDATLGTGSVDDLVHGLLERLRDAVGSDTATILVLDETGDVLRESASVGFDGPIGFSVPLGQGFAGGIAATQLPTVVADISQIEVVNPYLRDSGVVSLAGVPLLVDGRTIGVLHVGTKGPHGFEREDLLLLRLAASRIAASLERVQAHEQEHRIAETLQRSLLPSALPAMHGIEAAARYVPATSGITVGGDWYDAFALDDGSIGIAVGDVVGHGVAAAATMGRLRDVLRAFATAGFGAAETLASLNKMACRDGEDVFATVVYGIVSPDRASLRLASAGHPPPLLRAADGSVARLDEGRSLPIGASADAVYVEAVVPLEPASLMVFYTDGLVERRGESIDTGIDRLASEIATSASAVADVADRIIDTLFDANHTDDVVLVAVMVGQLRAQGFSTQLRGGPRSLAPMRAELRTWLRSVGAADDEIFDILVAVNEACSNAIEHPIPGLGAAATDQRIVFVEGKVVRREVSIVVRNPGRWKPSGPSGDRGRGLEFMDVLMEGVEVIRSPNETAVHLRRRLRLEVDA